MAIFLAAAADDRKGTKQDLHPIHIEALTIVMGNNPDTTVLAKNACRLLEMVGLEEVPVVVGCSNPLMRDFGGHGGMKFHGDNGFGNLRGVPAPSKPVAAGHAASFIVDRCRESPGEITILTLGPLSNVALALRLCPELPQLARRIVVMGGVVNARGNISPVAEANFFNDPEAAHAVVSAHWRSTSLVGLNVTTQVRMTDEYVEALATNAVGEFIRDISKHYRAASNKYEGMDMPVHDPSAVMFIIKPELFPETTKCRLHVNCEGTLCRGVVVADWVGHYEGKDADPERVARHTPTEIAWKADSEGFLKLYKALIAEL
eukprot:CAMPEP_0114622798 /NCGR_PEP_ID=MMETSP0168-20121206/9921_1 /TAXON_ID=95228 ORGANISM="Vannella sp., Strain DIVA3 517/6/12" /NCGR_SAMPLE_ID=MMETSP0168 /ASSEMBLY_ACC=CAM_ASM_000044 /LENGTH=317 /DNA_ID=CAMNT_0001834021 /DNA_START=85 /DNA_END=1038 /DNA_ORIENTATION=+